jgi:lipoprotein-anchoring transpeptidase ErfK/SrfK
MRMAAILSVGLVLVAATGAATARNIVITINKVSQKMTVAVDGESEYVWLVSTGAPGYDTPSGTYKPFRMEADHFSKEWDDAPMPHSIFFTPVGHAIHGSPHTKRLGSRASHGCVRLAPDNATTLYAMVQKAGLRNTTVIVKGGFFDFGVSELSPPPLKPPKWLKKIDPVKDFKDLFGR